MKIIQVCPRYYPNIGGVETHVKEISEMLVNKGFEVEVVCTDYSGKFPKNEEINGVKVKRFRAIAPKESYFFSPAIYFYLRSQEYDVLHAHSYHSFPAFLAALASKRRFIFTPHSFGFQKSTVKKIFHKLYRPFGSYIFKTADKVISIAQMEKKMLIKTFNIPLAKIIYLPLPIKFKPKNKLKYEKKITQIAFFGRLSREKNIDILIQAFKKVKNKNPECKLYIAGDGPLKKELEDIGKKVEDVYFTGPLFNNNLNDFIDDIDIFVLPSKFEVSPRSVIEAMSKGIPVVTTPVGDLPQVFRDGKDCLFANIGDPQDTAEKILWFMNNEKKAKEIAQSGKDTVEKIYDINNVISEYIMIYNPGT